MGFYGNISNVNRTQFSFDRIYSSRKAMEQARIGDGVYLGRFVLVEYDNDGLDGLQRVYRKNGTNTLYQDSSWQIALTKSTIEKGAVVYVLENEIYSFYRCTSDFVADSTNAATFEVISEITPNAPAYTRNYFIDTKEYGAGRGYDSTVWQKVYVNGNEKYVMIAELNTVVPKFEVAADAPTMNPIAPHFDTQSTDVYYKLHVQTPWGFRVAAASDSSLSDSETTWTTYDYDVNNGVHIEKTEKKNAAIYFNKAGFDKGNPSHVDGENEIKLTLASSGRAIYDDHNNTTTDTIASNDIQELTINLPEIGNMMSDAWDIIHGDDRKNSTGDSHPSLQGRLNAFSAMPDNTIAIKRSADGTLVGTQINGNTARTVTDIKAEKLHITDYDQDDAWIKTSINTVGLDNVNDLTGIAIHHTFTATQPTTTASNKNTNDGNGINVGDGDTLKLYTPIVDAAGHVVGNNTEIVTLPFGFKYIKTNGSSAVITNPSVNTNTIEADNTKDTMDINTANKWIRIANSNNTMAIGHEVNTITTSDKSQTDLNDGTDTITIQDTVFDEAGHVTANQKHTYILPYGYKTITIGDESTSISDVPAAAGSVVADNTQDTLILSPGNKWIHLTSDINNDTITVSHEVNSITTTKVDDTDLTTNTSASVTIPDWTYDEGGHIRSKQNHLYKLPFGYGQIKGDNNTSTAATVTYDELSIVTGDDWLTSSVSTDTVTITHKGPVAGTNTAATTPKPDFGAEFTFKTYDFDSKGHKFNETTHTVTIPKGSLTDNQANGADVITQLAFTDSSGALSTMRTNIGNLKITGYTLPTSVSVEALAATETLNTVLGKLEYRLNKEIADRTSAIAGLDFTQNEDNTQIITQITQTDGQITNVARAAAGTLVLGEGYSKAATGAALATSDSLNTAFGKIEKSLEDTNTRITNLIGGENLNEAFDTLKEVSDWLATDDTGADKIIDDIAILNSADTVEGSVAHAIKQAIGGLDVSDFAVDGQYVSQVTQTDGKIDVVHASLPTYILTPGESNGTVKFNDSEVSVTGLGSAAYTNSDDYVLVSRYNTDLSTKDAQINGLNFEAKRLTNEVNTIASSLDNYVTKEQYELDLATKDAQINGLNFEAKRLTNEVNALTAKVQSLEEMITKLIENIPAE